MSDRYDTDVMDDLFYEAAEGPAAMEGFEDEFEEGFEDEFEDELEDGFEEGFEEDGFEAMDEGDAMDALEEAVVDALGAEDADESSVASPVGCAAPCARWDGWRGVPPP
jgi:hypothetical protein